MEIDGRAEVVAVANIATDAGKAGTSAAAEAVDGRTGKLLQWTGCFADILLVPKCLHSFQEA